MKQDKISIKPNRVDITTFCSSESKAGLKLGEILTEIDDERQYAFVRRRLGVLYSQLKDVQNLKRYRIHFMREIIVSFEQFIIQSDLDPRLKTFVINIGKAKYRTMHNPMCENIRKMKSAEQSFRAKMKNDEIEKNRNSVE